MTFCLFLHKRRDAAIFFSLQKNSLFFFFYLFIVKKKEVFSRLSHPCTKSLVEAVAVLSASVSKWLTGLDLLH